MMDTLNGSPARWYDQYPNIAEIMNLIEVLPRPMQFKQAEAFHTVIHEAYKAKKVSTEVRSLGVDAVLSLYKSERRQRWYDNIPALHRATNLIRLFQTTELNELDQRCQQLATQVRDVYQQCQVLKKVSTQKLDSMPIPPPPLPPAVKTFVDPSDSALFLKLRRQVEHQLSMQHY